MKRMVDDERAIAEAIAEYLIEGDDLIRSDAGIISFSSHGSHYGRSATTFRVVAGDAAYEIEMKARAL